MTVETLEVDGFMNHFGSMLRSCVMVEQAEVVRDHFFDRVHKRFQKEDIEEVCHVFEYLYRATVNAIIAKGGGRDEA
jgi:hypothetical protein